MPELLEDLGEQEIDCTHCGQKAVLKSIIIRDSRPYKIITVMQCDACDTTETALNDCEALDYGVKIACDFSTGGPEHLRRMVFTNSNTVVTVGRSDKTLFDFTCDASNIDCVEGLLMRGNELLAMGKSEDDRKQLESVREELTGILTGQGFKMAIEDRSGYSRICPPGKEYAEIQDEPLEALNDEFVAHEKFEINEKA